jgi:ribosomal protein L6P/L9E
LTQKILDCVEVKVEDGQIVTSISNDENKPFRGLSRSLINNMIE